MRIIAGTARSRRIDAPKGRDTRPTLDRVRENLFNILQNRVAGAQVLDLFAGSGALALEAISRGAKAAVLVDCDRAANACQRENAERLGFSAQCRLLKCDWRAAVRSLVSAGERFDLVFLDPPYAMRDLSEVTEALKPLLAPEALVVVEHEAAQPSLVGEGFHLRDSRRYGYVGVSLYALEEEG